jgi:hypothetical protein
MPRKPYVFIGSSTEGKKFAEGIQLNLASIVETHIWDQGLFGLSEGTLESLINSLTNFDFAILVITGDDLTMSRGVEAKTPRDNVIFEIGLFMGGLGRDRVYIVADQSFKIKMPSDLNGISVAGFAPPERSSIQAAMGAASTLIREKIFKLGLRDIDEISKSYANDLKIINSNLGSRNLTMMSFEKLPLLVHPKFTREYILRIIEAYPNKIRLAQLSGGRGGIKLI